MSSSPPKPFLGRFAVGRQAPAQKVTSVPSKVAPVPSKVAPVPSAPGKPAVRLCPECKASMVLGKGRFGEYWQCMRFPTCKGSMSNKPIGHKRRKATTTPIRMQPITIPFNEWQKKVIGMQFGQKLVLASAGSGKTTVLAEWLSKIILRDQRTINKLWALAFGRDACQSIRERLCSRLGLPAPAHLDAPQYEKSGQDKTTTAVCNRVRTIHSWAWEHVKKIDPDSAIAGQGGKMSLYSVLSHAAQKTEVEPGPLVDIYESLTENLVDFGNPYSLIDQAGELNVTLDEQEAAVLIAARKILVEKKLFTFADCLRFVCEQIDRRTTASNVLRQGIEYLAVDEVQDSNRARLKIIAHLRAKAKAALFVGDIKQCIYAFAGAQPDEVLKMVEAKDYVDLPVTLRCPTRVVEFANDLVRGESWAIGAETIARDKAPEGFIGYVYGPDSRKRMVQKIVEQARGPNALRSGTGKDRIAVLARTNKELAIVDCLLTVQKIPTRWLGEPTSPWHQQIGQIIRGYLALGEQTTEYVPPVDCLIAAANHPNRNGSRAGFDKALELTQARISPRFWELYDKHKKHGEDDVVRAFFDRFKTFSFAERVDQTSNIIRSYLTRNVKSGKDIPQRVQDNLDILDALIESARILGSQQALEEAAARALAMKPDEPAVILSTVHKSKGIEWDLVHVSGVQDGMIPHYKSEDMNEEKRILYVAITRTRSELYLYCPDELSPFLTNHIEKPYITAL